MLRRILAKFGLVAILIGTGPLGVTGAATTEWLSLCGQCLSPSVTSKSGIGTDNAVAEAKITRQDAENWCSNWQPGDNNCVRQQLSSDDSKKTFRATANCPGGKITAIDGKAYSLSGVWASDVGKGRARFRDASGTIVGQDEGSGGLALAQQWELLCPGVVKAAVAAPTPEAAPHAMAPPPAGSAFAVGDAVEAKYGRDWLPGRIRKITETPGKNGTEFAYDVLLDNGSRGVLPANMVRRVSSDAAPAAVASQPIAAIPAAAQSSSLCGSQSNCTEVATFAATLSDFRTSVSGRFRIASAMIRFQNKTNRPLILGYVSGSGVTTDDQGNRYTIGANGVSAMGVIANQFDPKFVLQPGETGDARFEFGWVPGHSIIGTSYDMTLTVREINPVGNGSQYQLGAERVLHFGGLGKGGNSTAESPVAGSAMGSPHLGGSLSAAPSSASSSGNAPPTPRADPCAGKRRCYSSGPFVAEVQQMIETHVPRQNRLVRLDVSFRNISDQPVILGYAATTSSIIDNEGNQYYCRFGNTVDNSATGIGIVENGKADTSFVLQPGESRNAVFQLWRRADKTVIGTSFTWNVTIKQLQVLANGQQVTTLREYSMNFPDMSASGGH